MNNTNEIEDHITSTREALDKNVAELRNRVVDAADWRKQYENNTLLSLGLAVGGGLVLAAIFTPSYVGGGRAYTSAPNGNSNSGPSALSGLWAGLSAAFVSMATERVGELVDSVVPGFSEHYDKARRAQH